MTFFTLLDSVACIINIFLIPGIYFILKYVSLENLVIFIHIVEELWFYNTYSS